MSGEYDYLLRVWWRTLRTMADPQEHLTRLPLSAEYVELHLRTVLVAPPFP